MNPENSLNREEQKIIEPEATFDTKVVLKETYLSKVQHARAIELTCFLLGLLFLGAFFYLMDIAHGRDWMAASPEKVFQNHEYWRLFSTLLAHGDLGHLLSNTLLFIPFSIFLSRHFGLIFYPVLGILSAALANLLVLLTLPPEATLVGASGLVYWMGAAWITFYWLIEKRDSAALRLGKALMVGGVIFVPDVLRPNVSHMAHYLGASMGFLCALATYRSHRERILAAEKREVVLVYSPIGPEEWKGQHSPG